MADGGGLYLEVTPAGGKYWRMKYRFGGKEKRLAFGVYPTVSLKDARLKRDESKKLLSDGIDPGQQKKLDKLQRSINAENSFESVAREWHEQQKPSWTERYAYYVIKRLEDNIFTKIGFRPINELTAPELLSALREIEKRGAHEMSHRQLQACGQIFRYAIATGKAERDISADLKGALKTNKVEHYASLTERDLPTFLQALDNHQCDLQTKHALRLLLLTFVRTKELRGAKWEEIDFNKAEWRIPAERMKMRQPHTVPLSKQAIALFREQQNISGNREHVFPNRNKPKTFISENTMLYAIYRMGYKGKVTPHGFRATASTILNENNFRPDVIERQLAHGERNKVRAAYNHAQYLDERREMMQWWADKVDSLRGAHA